MYPFGDDYKEYWCNYSLKLKSIRIQMIQKAEKLQFDKGAVLCHFDIESNYIDFKITNIVAYSTFDSGIPEYPYLENLGDGWKLYAYNVTIEDGNPVPTYTATTTIYARKVTSVMMEIQEREMEKFANLKQRSRSRL